MNCYMNVKGVEEKWNISGRQVQIWCKSNRIPMAVQVSSIWIIPIYAYKPTKDKI